MNTVRRPADLPPTSPSLVLIGAAMTAWLATTPPKKRARIVRIIDTVLAEHGAESNVVVLRGVAQAPEVRLSFQGARAWWGHFRGLIEHKVYELEDAD